MSDVTIEGDQALWDRLNAVPTKIEERLAALAIETAAQRPKHNDRFTISSLKGATGTLRGHHGVKHSLKGHGKLREHVRRWDHTAPPRAAKQAGVRQARTERSKGGHSGTSSLFGSLLQQLVSAAITEALDS